MRAWIAAALVLVCASPAFAQGAGYKEGNVLSVVTVQPATCAPPDVIIIATVDPLIKVCTELNTWTTIAWKGGGVTYPLTDCPFGMSWTASTSTLECLSAPPGLPTGAIVMVDSGACPAGTSPMSEMENRVPYGTTIDPGTDSGSNTITPAGTNSEPAFTGSSANTNGVSGGTPAGTLTWPVGVPTHAGTAASFVGTLSTTVVNHVHTLATGTTATGNFSQVIGTVDTSSGGTGGTPTQTALGTLSGNPTAGGAANYTPAGTVNITSQGTIAWPAGVPTFAGSALGTHTHALTATGTVAAPVFTGTQFDNRQAWRSVIFCKAS